MRTITIEEFERDWEAVFRAVEAGETFVILRDGEPVLRAEPVGREGG